MVNNRRVALIAGASGGIGSSVWRELASQRLTTYGGYNRNEEKAITTAEDIRASDSIAESIHLDVSDGDLVEKVCEKIFEKEGRLDILVNCAATNRESPALGMEDETWKTVTETNLDGAFRLCRSAAKYMMLGRWGRIVNLSSITASSGGRGQINYAVSKAGVEAMTRVLALELGRKNILVNCVAPGVIETEMSERIRQEHGAKLLDRIAMRRFGKPKEIAEVIAFLISDSASYINGQVIRVDGGMIL